MACASIQHWTCHLKRHYSQSYFHMDVGHMMELVVYCFIWNKKCLHYFIFLHYIHHTYSWCTKCDKQFNYWMLQNIYVWIRMYKNYNTNILNGHKLVFLGILWSSSYHPLGTIPNSKNYWWWWRTLECLIFSSLWLMMQHQIWNGNKLNTLKILLCFSITHFLGGIA
jgi:hypothetical protein